MHPPRAQHHWSSFWIKASEETHLSPEEREADGCLDTGGVTPYRDGGVWGSSGKVPIMGVPSSLSLLSIGDIENFT